MFVVTSLAVSRLVRNRLPQAGPTSETFNISVGGDNAGARVDSTRLLFARMEGDIVGDGDASGDLEAPLLDASRIEDDIQEEEPTAAFRV